MSRERSDKVPMPSGEDLKMMGRAVKGRWPIPDEKREAIANVLVAVVEDDDWLTSTRDRIAAARVLESMDKLNMEQEKRDEIGMAEVVKLEHSGQIDLATLTDDQLRAIAERR